MLLDIPSTNDTPPANHLHPVYRLLFMLLGLVIIVSPGIALLVYRIMNGPQPGAVYGIAAIVWFFCVVSGGIIFDQGSKTAPLMGYVQDTEDNG